VLMALEDRVRREATRSGQVGNFPVLRAAAESRPLGKTQRILCSVCPLMKTLTTGQD
jgi:hypothetical protein